MFLILTAVQADALRGPTSEGAELAPVALTDGERWVLPLAVLDDPVHVVRHAELASLPQGEVSPSEFPAPPALLA